MKCGERLVIAGCCLVCVLLQLTRLVLDFSGQVRLGKHIRGGYRAIQSIPTRGYSDSPAPIRLGTRYWVVRAEMIAYARMLTDTRESPTCSYRRETCNRARCSHENTKHEAPKVQQ